MMQVKVLYFVIYNSTDIKPIELRDVLPKPDVIPGRVGRRTKRQISGQTQTSVEGRSLIKSSGFVLISHIELYSFFLFRSHILYAHTVLVLYIITYKLIRMYIAFNCLFLTLK